MGYYIDLKSLSIDEYKEALKSADLIPSQMILKENINDIFDNIKKQEIENVEELREALKSKSKLQDFSKQSGLSEDYLKVLIRNVNSYRQKPNKIKDIPGVSEDAILSLENLGIKNTLQLFDKILTPQSRSELSHQTGISEGEILTLAKLTDLSRITWVNHTFAYVLLEAGYDTAEKVANADYKELYDNIKKLNEDREIYKGHIGLRDMNRCIEAAKDIPLEVEY